MTCLLCGGEKGIRTLDTLRYTHFPGVRLRPLGHLSFYMSATNFFYLLYDRHPLFLTLLLCCSATKFAKRNNKSKFFLAQGFISSKLAKKKLKIK